MWEIGVALWLLMLTLTTPPPATARVASQQPVTFASVQPILEKRCQPCHFSGGKMHARLPFDRAETVDQLGTRLFTRIKNDDEQATIRAFLARKK
jgi:hypothetical protein